MRYAQADQLKRWVSIKTGYMKDADGVDYGPMLEELLDAASRKAESDTGRLFYLSSGQARTYYVDQTHGVPVVDLLSGAGRATPTVLYDADRDDTPETTLAASDYVLEPRTEWDGAPATRHQRLRLVLGASTTLWPGTPVQITADWGHVDANDDPPDEIVQATILAAARLWARRGVPFIGPLALPDLGVVLRPSKIDADYHNLIKAYIHPRKKMAFA